MTPEHYSRAAKRIKHSSVAIFAERQIDHDASELWRKHPDEGVSLGAGLIPGGDGGDILSADTLGNNDFATTCTDDNELDFVARKTEFVVVGGS